MESAAERHRWKWRGKMIRAAVVSLGLLAIAIGLRAEKAVWQWSVPMGDGRAFLWIPEECQQLRAVVVAQHNMIEQRILEHPEMRATLASLGIGEVFVAPPFDRVFRFDHGAGERFAAMMEALAKESGYGELSAAPVVPMGHSACASYPWNFAAWNPGRTLAVLSVKGDAPLSPLTGSGAPNPAWGARSIDGVPGLMVMSEGEWWDARLEPALGFSAAHPAVPLAMYADIGHGHFDASDELVRMLALFIRRAAEARLTDNSDVLRAVDVESGWRMDRWRGNGPPCAKAAPEKEFTGPRAESFWCFDEEMARVMEASYATTRGKKKQQVDFVQNGALVPMSTTHAGVELAFLPEADGITFSLTGEFIEPLPEQPRVAAKDRPPAPRTTKPLRAAAGDHASGPIVLSIITGPAEQIRANTFRVAFNRTSSTTDPRDHQIWFAATHEGDSAHKGVVQQALLSLPTFQQSAEQTITFPEIPNQSVSGKSIALAAMSDRGLPVGYYIREGPACVEQGILNLTKIPPRARWPIRVTVVAWQLGRGSEPKVRAAKPVERSFLLTKP